MRSFRKSRILVAAAALLASSTATHAASADDIQALRDMIDAQSRQIDGLSKELNALKATPDAQAGVPADAAKIPANAGPGFLQFGSSAGGFVIPGTKTALKVGGNMNLQAQYDLDAGAGSAGGDAYVIRPGNINGSSGFALPGTPGALQTGRFSANATYSRLTAETRTPSEYGEIKFYTEFDFAGTPAGGNQYNSNSHTARLRHVYGTIGNLTIGQLWTLWSDRATVVNSILNNGPGGPESGVRQPLVQYRWDIDTAQKNQLYVSAENPFSDFLGADTENLTGTVYNNPTNFNTKYPDILARYAYNDSWGRIYLTGLLRDISINTLGQGNTSPSLRYTGAADDSTLGWGATTGGKIYTGLWNPKNAVFLRLVAGQGIGRYMNFNSGSQNPSAVLDMNGKLKSLFSAGYEVAYQHFLTSTNTWQTNLIWSDQKDWQKNSLMAFGGNGACAAGGAVAGECGLPLRLQNIELNVQWSPNSYVSMGPAFVYSTTEVAKGLNLVGVASSTRATSGTTAHDSRFIYTTNIGF